MCLRSIFSFPFLSFRIVFYRRVSPRSNLDLFMYIVCVECWNVNNSNLIHMLDFVQGRRKQAGLRRDICCLSKYLQNVALDFANYS